MLIGILLGLFGTFFEEANNSITKHKSTIYHFLQVGVIVNFFVMITFLASGLYKTIFTDISLYLNPDSVPYLALRMILEILQSYFTILAIKHADRSTFSIVRILTIPLLLISDIMIGYEFSTFSIIGIGVILASFLIFNAKDKTINMKGIWFVLFTAINAVFTLTLYKYSLSVYGNSVEVDQFIVSAAILIFFIVYNYKENKNCAIKMIKGDKLFILQGIAIGLSSLALSYSILFINASEATAIKRAGEMFWSILAGVFYFKEKNLYKKLIFAGFLIGGLIIMLL